MTNQTLLILNGPGLTDVQSFASDEFGVTSLDQIRSSCESLCSDLGIGLDFRQSDDQNQIVDWIREEAGNFAALIINQMGCANTSPVDYPKYCADLGILATLPVPVTEIHLTNVLRFDPDMFQALPGPPSKTALICGLGLDSYRVAIRAAVKRIKGQSA